jgi:hypothetical protein
MTPHYLQSRADGCVAAAMCIIQRWRGQIPTENAFLAAVTVVSQHYEEWLRRRYPALTSPHGSFGGATMWLHMVVLVGRARDAFDLLDPFFVATGQPLRIDDDEFVACFGGHAFVAPR